MLSNLMPLVESVLSFARKYPFERKWKERRFTNDLCQIDGFGRIEAEKPYPIGTVHDVTGKPCDNCFFDIKHWQETKFLWTYGDENGKQPNKNLEKWIRAAADDVAVRLNSLMEHAAASSVGMLIVAFDSPSFPFDEGLIERFDELAEFDEAWSRKDLSLWDYPAPYFGTIRAYYWWRPTSILAAKPAAQA